MKRRDPALSGVAGITAEDLDALDQGRTTLQTIADRLGCTKQNISKKIRAMRSASSTGPGTPPEVAAAPTAPAGPNIPAGSILIDAHQAAVSANLGILHRAAGLLEGPDALGPSAVKMLAGAVASARAELVALGTLDTNDDDDTALSTLTVRVLSDTEHDELKLKGEQLARDDYED